MQSIHVNQYRYEKKNFTRYSNKKQIVCNHSLIITYYGTKRHTIFVLNKYECVLNQQQSQ